MVGLLDNRCLVELLIHMLVLRQELFRLLRRILWAFDLAQLRELFPLRAEPFRRGNLCELLSMEIWCLFRIYTLAWDFMPNRWERIVLGWTEID